MSEWISVKDRPPEVGSIVVWGKHQNIDLAIGIYSVKFKRNKSFTYFIDSIIPLTTMIDGERANLLIKENAITHWMPLPEPPKGDTE